MKTSRLFPSFLLAALFALLFLVSARGADVTTNTIKFSDPAKPGTLRIAIAQGDLHLQGADTDEISVQSEARVTNRPARKDGLRVLTSASSFSLTEKDNVVTLDAAESFGRGADFQLTVPRGTSVVVQSSFGGDITSRGLAGDYEIHSMNGEITLEDVSGGVVVDTLNGEIRASIRELKPNKPLSFTSMNGEVVLRVPADAKASIRLRTQNGAVLTDFDETALITRAESAPRMARNRRNPGPVLPPEATEAIRNAARLAVQAGREAAEAARQGIEAARERAEADREKAEIERELARADAYARRTTGRGDASSGAPTPPVPPVPPIPTITGGKLITGTLNGGGPEISVATMNGDVTLRKIEKK